MLVVLCVASITLLALAAAGCGPPGEVKVGMKDKGKLIQLVKGQDLMVELGGNPSTGFAWDVTSVNEEVLLQMGQAGFEPRSGLLGAPGVETFRFRAVKAGKVPLRMAHHRLWEDSKPDKTFDLKLEVR